MPLGPYKDFQSAVDHFIAKGDTAEVARKKAGEMKKRIEGMSHKEHGYEMTEDEKREVQGQMSGRYKKKT